MTEAEKPIQVVPIWRVVVGGLIVLGIISFLCWPFGWCWWWPDCPDCPDVDCCDGGESDAAAEIILEDMHAGVWMAMENTVHFESGGTQPASICVNSDEYPDKAFGVCAGNYEMDIPTDEPYRHGVLFQTGPGVEITPGTGPTTAFFYGGVYIVHDEGEAWLLPPWVLEGEAGPDFDWLDVMATGTKCVIDPSNAYMMLHNLEDETTGIASHISDAHAEDLAGAPFEDLVDNQCDSDSTDSQAAFSCPRNRSLHASLLPTRIITYWAGEGPDFYEMAVKPTDEIAIPIPGKERPANHPDPQHVSYHFRLPEEVVVDRWKNGCFEERYTGVTLIRILHLDKSAANLFHLGYPHRPMDGEY